MSCPRNRNRWAGSGFRKEDMQTNGLSEQMKKMMEERDKQDLRLFPQTVQPTVDEEPARATLVKKLRVVETNKIVYPSK